MHDDLSSDFATLEPVLRDRRKDNPLSAMLLLIKQIHESQVSLDQKLTHHITEETDELARAIAKLLAEAFPDGDSDGHRRHHELVMAREEERMVFWKEMRVAAAKWLGLGVLTFLAGAAWTQLLKGPHA